MLSMIPPPLPPPSNAPTPPGPPGTQIYGGQQTATANLLGSPYAGATDVQAYGAQQATTSNLLGGSPTGAFPAAGSFTAQQATTSNLLGSPGGAGVGAYAMQQGATANLFGSPRGAGTGGFAAQPGSPGGIPGGFAGYQPGSPGGFGTQQAATANLLGSHSVPAYGASGLDITAGQLTPLGAAPGSSALTQQQAGQLLLGGGFTAAQQETTNRLLGAGGGNTASQEATARLLGVGSAPAGEVAYQQEATSRLLSSPGVDALQGQETATRLLAAVETAQNRVNRQMEADGLRQRAGDRGFTQHAKRAAERAEAEITRFGLVLNGEIQSAQLGASGRGPLMCVFSVQHGADWTIVSGAPNGITQLATSSLPPATSFSSALFRGGNPQEVVWNFPIGLALKSTSPFGWPRLVITVYGTDLCNRRVIKGYGSVHVPCQPGRHTRTIRLYCPISSSPFTRILGAIFGNPAQLVDPRLVAGTEGREVVRVQSGGKVTVMFDTLLKDTEPFHYTF